MNVTRRLALRCLPSLGGLPLVARLSFVSIAGVAGCASRGQLADLGELTTNDSVIRWQFKGGEAGIGFSPALGGDLIWAADQRGRMTAIERESGKVMHQFDLKRSLVTGVAVDAERQVVIDAEGVLLVLDRDGTTRWSASLGAEPTSLPAIAGGLVLIRLSNGSLVAHDLRSGERRWLYLQSDPPLVLRQTSGIATDAVNAYVGLSSGLVVALSLASGATLWESRISVARGANEIERINDVVGMPVIDGATICAAAYQGRVTCLNANNGEPIWSEDLRAASGIAMNRQRQMIMVDVDGNVTAFSPRRERLWQQQALRGRRPAAPALIGDRLWIGDGGGVAHSLDPLDGRLTGRVAIDRSAIVAAPIAVPGAGRDLALFQTSAGRIAALDTA